MTLRCPKPLPYEWIDEWIDATVKFAKPEPVGEGLLRFSAEPRGRYKGSQGRLMMQLIEDFYSEDSFSSPMIWTAKELTEEEIDYILNIVSPPVWFGV